MRPLPPFFDTCFLALQAPTPVRHFIQKMSPRGVLKSTFAADGKLAIALERRALRNLSPLFRVVGEMSEQTTPPVDVDLVGRVVGGRFRIERRLGGGGMGTVWRAHDEQLLRPCAVKTLHAGSLADPDARERFIREARAAAAIGGRYVVGFVAADFDPGDDALPSFPFLAMDLLKGEDLEQRLQSRGPFAVDEALTFLGQAAKALDRAHELGIVHRDIKPENIFLAQEDDEEVAKVLDFGIAKVTAELSTERHRLTRSNATLGSPLYIAPEQILDTAGAEAQSDLWSFALVAFRILTGRDFWKLTDLANLVHQICYEPLPSAYERSGGRLTPDVDAWFTKALAREPHARFGSATEMVAALAKTLAEADPGSKEDQPLPTETPGDLLQSQAVQGVAKSVDGHTPVRLGPAKRARGPLIAGALFVLCAAVVAGFISSQFRGEDHREVRASPDSANFAASLSLTPPSASEPSSPPSKVSAAPSATASASASVGRAIPTSARPPRPRTTSSGSLEAKRPPAIAPTQAPKDDDFGNITRQ
jgi:eukaryotic-like serine/threonine-protein kinase